MLHLSMTQKGCLRQCAWPVLDRVFGSVTWGSQSPSKPGRANNPVGFLYLVASTNENYEGAAPAAPESNERSEGGASDNVSLARCPDCL